MIYIDRSELVTGEAVTRAEEACGMMMHFIARQKMAGNDTRHAQQLHTALSEALADARARQDGAEDQVGIWLT
ncbi:MAG: hypothetical protein K2X62_02395 [Beijerinckiaceae bacterium]|nr:hypothetical protein [Beijerinckiaceae bacterium]MDO9440686.1 hypothetical protein [Beijerinckiaceae bacterium]